MPSLFEMSKETAPNTTCNLILNSIIFIIPATSPTGQECSFRIEDSLRPNGPAEKNYLLVPVRHDSGGGPLSSHKSSEAFFYFFFLHNYIETQEFIDVLF